MSHLEVVKTLIKNKNLNIQSSKSPSFESRMAVINQLIEKQILTSSIKNLNNAKAIKNIQNYLDSQPKLNYINKDPLKMSLTPNCEKVAELLLTPKERENKRRREKLNNNINNFD